MNCPDCGEEMVIRWRDKSQASWRMITPKQERVVECPRLHYRLPVSLLVSEKNKENHS